MLPYLSIQLCCCAGWFAVMKTVLISASGELYLPLPLPTAASYYLSPVLVLDS